MVVCFDLNGTLTDVRALTGDDRGVQVFDQALMLAMAESLTGTIRPLYEYFQAVLERDLPDLAKTGMERLKALPAFPEAVGALRILRDAGLRTAVVTNSSQAAAEATLAANGLADLIDDVVGSDGIGVYKPDPRVYANAAARLGADPAELWLVAAHAWDVQGAIRAGWRGAWVGHTERALSSTVPADVSGATLTEVAEQLVRRAHGT